MQIEDKYIIQKCLNGETEAFGFLVDRYKQSVYAFAYSKLRNRQDAEDVTQKVFIKAYQKLRTLKQWDNMHAWLYSITANMCKDWIRVQSRRPDRSFIEDQDPKKIDSLSIDSQDNDPMIESLNEALESLPEIYRQVLTLYYLGDRDSKEIANFLGISPTSVRQRLTRARDLLKEEMIAMMSKTYEAQRLPVGFTFRIVESIRRIKIDSMSIGKGVPWGLSLATGLLIAVIGLNPHFMKIIQTDTFASPALSGESSVLEIGNFPVDIAKISENPFIANQEGADVGKSSDNNLTQNAIFMAPQGEGGTWAKKADMPTARYCLGTTTVNGKIYAIGGTHSPDGAGLSVVEEYDPTTDIWKQKSDMPTARVGLSIETVNGKIYAIGGYLNWTSNALSTVEEYNPIGDKWTTKADMPTKRGFFGTATLNNKIFAIGGDSGNVNLSTVEVYDPSSDKWEKKKDMITTRSFIGAKAVNGKIYAIGGRKMPSLICLSTVEEYDPLLDKWEQKSDIPDLPKGISEYAISEVSGKIYVIGGCDGGDYFLTTREYDPITDRWEKKSDMLAKRISPLSATAINGKIYVIGGGNLEGQGEDNWLSTVEEYTLENWNSVSPQSKLPTKWGEIKR